MYAVIKTGGKQLKVEVGQEIFVEKLDVEESETGTFEEVLLVVGDETKVGNPYVDGANVVAKVLKQGKDRKIIVYKYKPKTNYKKKQGHRQAYTKLVVEAINA